MTTIGISKASKMTEKYTAVKKGILFLSISGE
jgi:hypothetical protein